MAQRPIVAGNWKMNLSLAEAHELAWNTEQLAFAYSGVEVGAFIPSLYVGEIARLARIDGAMLVGAQNCYGERKGAFTGEVSPTQLLSAGVSRVLLGHSERRQLFFETNEAIAAKVALAFTCGLHVTLCVGETKAQRESGETGAVVTAQIQSALEGVDRANGALLVIAYEPVWAIGTGDVASADMISEAHGIVRETTSRLGFGPVPVIYGGSVSDTNARDLAGNSGVDGFLVGGASLEIDKMRAIVEAVATARQG